MHKRDDNWLLIKLNNFFLDPQNSIGGGDKREFLKKIKKEKYIQALHFACQRSQGKDVFYRIVEILLSHKQQLNLNINQATSDGKNAIYLATENENLWLYDLLERHGADIGFEGPNGSVALLHTAYYSLQLNVLMTSRMDARFANEKKKLEAFFEEVSNLPCKGSLVATEEVKKADQKRLQFINYTLHHLETYFKEFTDNILSPLQKGFTDNQKKIFAEYMLSCARNRVEELCHVIHDLSGPLRKKYDNFELPGFSWMTFEQLGSSMLREKACRRFFLPFSLKREVSVTIPAFIERLHHELADTELLVEEAIPDILKHDIPRLRVFFKEITDAESQTPNAVVKPVALPFIKTVTGRIVNNLSFLKLFNLFHFTEQESLQGIPYPEQSFYFIAPDASGKNSKTKDEPKSLASMRSKQALLRRLQKIGELFVGRNFPSELFDLDPTVDWRALVTVRDGICHQDERNNLVIVNTLLQNEKRLQKILQELEDLKCRVFDLLQKRDKILGPYEEPQKLWAHLVKSQIEKKNCPEQVIIAEVSAPVRRIDISDEKQFLKILADNKVSAEIQKQFQAIFDGTCTILPNKKELGELCGKAYLSLSKDEKTACRKIMEKITFKPITTEADRNKKREEEKNAKEEREKNKNSQLTGLEQIRGLAKEFLANPAKENLLNPLKRVTAAKQALQYISDYLRECNYLVGNTKYTFVELENFHQKNGSPSLKEILSNNHELNDALEYNVGQLLQHLEQLFDNNHLENIIDLTKQRERLRKIRNYIEHGDPILDTMGEDYHSASEVIRHDLYCAMIELIYDKDIDLIAQYFMGKSSVTNFSIFPAMTEQTSGNNLAPFNESKQEI
ncbi:hypothetical protein [Legionella cardiaca]|uniref:Ankyrin repeats (3 copies) n=1 Tax=Legionella cardiaca TaxID=1071983 RepID=A0ABY8APV4_9GAMM|nr:hypothetical protein [Legionella cardiaca]WED42677.1 hypothetical protein PXX05_12335 [Legionella cardiaca]